MRNLIRAEYKCGAIFRKAMALAIWLFFLWAMIYAVRRELRYRPDWNFDRDFIKTLRLWAIFELVYLALMIRSFLRFTCIPYWNKILKTSQLAQMLENEEFIPIEGRGKRNKSGVMVSDNWAMIQGYLYSKHFTAFIEPTGGYNRPSYSQLNACMINGDVANKYISYVWPKTETSKIMKAIGINGKWDYTQYRESRGKDIYRTEFREAFEKVSGGRTAAELYNTDLRELRNKWRRKL